jgi:hypothetical protein
MTASAVGSSPSEAPVKNSRTAPEARARVSPLESTSAGFLSNLEASEQAQPERTDSGSAGVPGHEAPQWSDSRAEIKADEKQLMADYFAEHEFLLPSVVLDLSSATDESRRTPSASIIVNAGTAPNQVVYSALAWVEKNPKLGPFFLFWYTPGHLVPETLRRFRTAKGNLHMAAAVRLFLFPGEVDFETQSVCGPDAEAFANNLKRRFTYAFLSAYAFDIHTGDVYFHGAREVALQRAVATRFAATKFLFLDSSKFKSEGDGENGYTVSELLETSHTVTIYTVSVDDERDRWVLDGFDKLGRRLFGDTPHEARGNKKRLCLRIVGHNGQLTNPENTVREGYLAQK